MMIIGLAILWTEYLRLAYKSLLIIQDKYTRQQLKLKKYRTLKANEEEYCIVYFNKYSLQLLKSNLNWTTLLDLQHGDIKDLIYNLYIDIKCSTKYIASITQYSIENFNPNKKLDHYYICINLSTREVVIIEHMYLYNLIINEKVQYIPTYDENGELVNIIGQKTFNQILADSEIYNPEKIKKFIF